MTKQEISRKTVHVERIPKPLKALKQWVCWRLEADTSGKPTKVPYRPDGDRSRKASHSDPATWGTFQRALTCFEADEAHTGIGVVLGNGLVGVDLDGFPRQRELPAWAACHVQRLDTYTEWSPSGHGVHMLAWGELPPGRRRTGPKDPHGIEMYDGRRFFTVTGDRLDGYDTIAERRAELAAMHAEVFADQNRPGDQRRLEEPTQPRDKDGLTDKARPSTAGSWHLSDPQVLELARHARNADKFSRLWAGDAAEYRRADGTPDRSAADQALCNLLAFYTRDSAQIDRLFRRSGLLRPKWDEVHAADGRTYGEMTIGAALSFVTEVYAPSPRGKGPPRAKGTPRDETTARGRHNGRGQGTGEYGEKGAAKRGRPCKAKLITEDYARLYEEWGYNARLNLCNDDVEVNGAYLNDITLDEINAKVRDYGTLNNVSVNVRHAAEALSTVATANAYHPMRDYLETAKWDGGQHIKKLAGHFSDEDGLFYRWLRQWLAGSVARIYDGYQNPMLVLDGQQDVGKSFFARWICPLEDYFVESAISPESKDCLLRLIQTWVWEVSELGTTTRKGDVEALKAFLTRRNVRERKAYGRRDIIKPAAASFVGTINNESGFLVDRTGNRRFLVCTLTDIDWRYAKEVDVHQVWAEALHIYRGDDDWRLSDGDKTERDVRNTSYMVDDPVETYLDLYYTFTGRLDDFVPAHAILSDLQMHGILPSKPTTMAIASVLKSWGAVKERKTTDGKRQTIYYGVTRDIKTIGAGKRGTDG